MFAEQRYAELSVCTDCVILIANGETDPNRTEEATQEFLTRFEKGMNGVETITLGSIECEHCGQNARKIDRDTEECEPWFSSSSCEHCGSPLGGDRHHAVAWLEREPLICEYGTEEATHIMRDSGELLCLAHAKEQYTDWRQEVSKLTPRTLKMYSHE